MHIMNAEYESHERIWEMLKPRVYAQLEPNEPLAWARPPAGVPILGLLNWHPASIDLALLAHGHQELNSPLSEW
jgi:hypothetical protein